MTPEEILAECPEYFVLDWICKSPTIYKERGTGRDVNPKEVEKIAQSRKEARELREKNAKLVAALQDSRLEHREDCKGGCVFDLMPASVMAHNKKIDDALQKYRSTENV